ncbi:MAG: O-antigen ligase family protein [Actinobacteria bacterium]|nr:O-antigen ligase family protein [Actinomycetota bacterium]
MSNPSNAIEGNVAVARLSAWLGTGGVLILTAWLAANDGGYFSREFLTAAVCGWTLAGLVILLDWDRLEIPRTSLLPLLFSTAILFWTGASTFWSISPDSSLNEFSRVAIYVACFFLVLTGSANRRDIILSTAAFTLLGTALGGFALLAKISPGYSQEFAIAGGRIMGSLGYWNALAIFMVISILPCLWISSSPEIPRSGRVAAASALFVLGVTLFFTLSRGGLAIGAISVLLWLAVSRERLASLLSLLAAVLPAGALISFTYLSLPSLHSSDAAARIDPAEGRQFAIALIAGVVVTGVLKSVSLFLPSSLPDTRRWLTYALVFWLSLFVVVAAIGLSQRTRITDKLDEWKLRDESRPGTADDGSSGTNGISRLTTLDGERIEHWRIGVENFKEHPLVGTGAGTYRFANLQKQSGVGLARDPHSIWIRFLSDQGALGFLLLAGLTVTIAFGLIRPLFTDAAVRRDGLYLSMLVALGAWLADSSLEWNWELPAVAIPFFLIAGLAFRLEAAESPAGPSRQPGSMLMVPVWLRMTAMALAVLLSAMCLALIGSETFSERARGRLAAGDLDAAARNASRAGQLNPFDTQSLIIESEVATARGDYPEARSLLLDAVELEPEQSSHLESLALIEFYDLHDTAAGIASLTRAIDLDPQQRELHLLLHRLHADAETFAATGELPEGPPETSE